MTNRPGLILPAAFVIALALSVCFQGMATISSTTSRATESQDPNARVTAQPLRDWLLKTNGLRASGLINLDSGMEFTVDVKRDSDCRLSEVVVVQKSGDQRFLEPVRELVAALSDSGLLSFLGDRPQFTDTPCVSIPMRFNFKNDPGEILSSLEYPASSSERAASIAKAYNVLIDTGRTVKRGHPDELIYNAMHASSESNQITVHFRMSRTNVEDILRSLLSR